MSDLPLTTARLELRRIGSEDSAQLHAILSDPAAMRYWSTRPHETLAVTEAWITKTIAAVAKSSADDFAIVLNGAVIGKVGLWQANEIGIILSPAHWKRGFAEEAMHAIITRAFVRGIDRIVADIDPRNEPSLRLFRRLGFRVTGSAKGSFNLGECWADSLYLALTSEDWFGGSAPAARWCGQLPSGAG